MASDCKESEKRPPVLLLVSLVAMLSFACIGASAADTKSDETASDARVKIGEIEHKIASAADIASRSTVRIAWGKDDSDAAKNGDTLRKGDVIVSLEGQPIPDFKTYLALTEKPGVGVAPVFAGDPLRVTIRRGNELLDLRMRVRPEVNLPDRSLRRSGFSSVFDTDSHVSPDECGGPVMNVRGEVIGILIAQDGNERSYVVPASVARAVYERLRAK